tara:strand:- start:15 stop:398 length:384 start_codon:yes stop_codon:yes gene_type:complete
MYYDDIKKYLEDEWKEGQSNFFKLDSAFMSNPLKGGDGEDVIPLKPRPKRPFHLGDDRVNHPSHYTRGNQEVIVTIEEAIQDAPNMTLGYLQGQVLKYLLRCWLKDNPVEDLKKAKWYLDRLISKLT